jgi:Spy/CpxP family protein refolding chaperone
VRTVHLAIALSIALAAAPAAAQPSGPQLEALAGDLGLSSAQLAQIRALVDAGRKQEIALRAQMETIEVDLRRELARAAPDESKVAGWADKLGSLDGSLRKSRILTWIKLRKLLTPAQRTKLESSGGRSTSVAAGAKVGELRINAKPWASITIDGRAVGETPLITDLEPGVHVVRAENPGHDTVSRSVVVVPGQSVELMLELDPSAGGGARLQRADISSGIARVRDNVKACGRKYAFTGTATASIVIASDGRASLVSIDAGAPAFRDCVSAALRAARFPRGKDSTTVRYPFVFR